MKSLIHSQTSTVEPLKFEDGYVITSDTFLGMWLLIHDGITVNNNMTVCIWMGNSISFTMEAGLSRLHMPSVKKSRA